MLVLLNWVIFEKDRKILHGSFNCETFCHGNSRKEGYLRFLKATGTTMTRTAKSKNCREVQGGNYCAAIGYNALS